MTIDNVLFKRAFETQKRDHVIADRAMTCAFQRDLRSLRQLINGARHRRHGVHASLHRLYAARRCDNLADGNIRIVNERVEHSRVYCAEADQRNGRAAPHTRHVCRRLSIH
ncbi:MULTISPECIES: hypothetical protein [unclassified Caballeronia]|uniref:hypothetical protein n=1 Tax=unclassified Caballeronia TaxID=2646786 RepID=UPI003ECC1E07